MLRSATTAPEMPHGDARTVIDQLGLLVFLTQNNMKEFEIKAQLSSLFKNYIPSAH